MKKITLSFSALIFLNLAGFAQTNKEGIDRKARDPKTAEQAGKADVYILKKQTMEKLQQNPVPLSHRKKAKKNYRKKSQ